MFALFLTALLTATAVVAASVLVDCGLRWWSAFGALRRELKGETTPLLPSLRPAVAKGGYSAFGRCAVTRAGNGDVSRAA